MVVYILLHVWIHGKSYVSNVYTSKNMTTREILLKRRSDVIHAIKFTYNKNRIKKIFYQQNSAHIPPYRRYIGSEYSIYRKFMEFSLKKRECMIIQLYIFFMWENIHHKYGDGYILMSAFKDRVCILFILWSVNEDESKIQLIQFVIRFYSYLHILLIKCLTVVRKCKNLNQWKILMEFFNRDIMLDIHLHKIREL